MQKKNRKGFTLIELLAVIVILAIIALIAVPVIMNVITKARVSAFEDSAYGIVKAGEMYYTNKLLDAEGMTEEQEFTVVGDVFQNTKNSAETLDLSGSLPSSGKVKVTTDGKVALAISNGEYCIRKATTESKVKAEKLSDLGGTCNYKNLNTVFTTSTDGTSVPACITDNTPCDATAAGDDGIKVGVKVNDTTIYDFYVISEDTSKNKITLIMGQDLEGAAKWSVSRTTANGPVTVLDYLESKTSGWTNIPATTYELTDENNLYSPMTITNARARLITYTEATELGCTTEEESCPRWLYEDITVSPYAYWTSSADAGDSDAAWVVSQRRILSGNIGDTYNGGVRPVITISKTVL